MVPHTTDQPASFPQAKSGLTVNGNVISLTKAKGNRLIHTGIPDTNTPQLHYPLCRRRGPCSTKCELLSVGFPGVERGNYAKLTMLTCGVSLVTIRKTTGRVDYVMYTA